MSNPISGYKPSAGLSPYVELYWEGSFNADAIKGVSMQMVPNGCLELIIHLNDLHCELHKDKHWSLTPDYIILGLYTRPYEVRFNGTVTVFAIRFKPEGIYNVFGVPASFFRDSYEDMSMVLGSGFSNFCNRLKEEKSIADMVRRTEEYLFMCLQRNNIDRSYVNLAAELIRNTKGIRMDDLCGMVYISQRQLEREFKEKVGITPKHYLRLTRINEVMRLLNEQCEMDLTSVAYHCGYSDQAHFINDFKRITGEKPTIYMKERDRFIVNPGQSYYA